MKSKITALILLLTAVAAALVLWGGSGSGCVPFRHMGPEWFGIFHSGGLFMMISTLLLTGLLIFLAVKYFSDSKNDTDKKEDPMNVLKVRYARGELSKEDFESMKNELRKD